VKPSRVFGSAKWCQIVLVTDGGLPDVTHLLLYYLFLGAMLMGSEVSYFIIANGESNAIRAAKT
jgi:hypothetical protein